MYLYIYLIYYVLLYLSLSLLIWIYGTFQTTPLPAVEGEERSGKLPIIN